MSPRVRIDVRAESMLDAWLRHVQWAIGRAALPSQLAVAERTFPILKDARYFLPDSDYRALVGTLNPEYRDSVRVHKDSETS